MKNSIYLLLIAAAMTLLVSAVAGDESMAAAQHEEAEAINSRDWAARQVCQGQAFEWHGDTLTCYREKP